MRRAWVWSQSVVPQDAVDAADDFAAPLGLQVSLKTRPRGEDSCPWPCFYKTGGVASGGAAPSSLTESTRCKRLFMGKNQPASGNERADQG